MKLKNYRSIIIVSLFNIFLNKEKIEKKKAFKLYGVARAVKFFLEKVFSKLKTLYNTKMCIRKKFFQKPVGLELYCSIAWAGAKPYIFVFFLFLKKFLYCPIIRISSKLNNIKPTITF